MLEVLKEGLTGSQSGFLALLGAFVNVCVNVYIVHKTRFLLDYSHLEDKDLTSSISMLYTQLGT